MVFMVPQVGKMVCPDCGGRDFTKFGVYARDGKREQKWLCHTCGRVTIEGRLNKGRQRRVRVRRGAC